MGRAFIAREGSAKAVECLGDEGRTRSAEGNLRRLFGLMAFSAGVKAPLPLFRYAHPGLEARGFQKQSGASTWGRWRDELAATKAKSLRPKRQALRGSPRRSGQAGYPSRIRVKRSAEAVQCLGGKGE